MMRHLMTFTVEGNGAFPMDMLRYDSCFPKNSEDSRKIGFTRDDSEYLTGIRQVHLQKWVERKNSRVSSLGPTVGRWRSFGWIVVGNS